MNAKGIRGIVETLGFQILAGRLDGLLLVGVHCMMVGPLGRPLTNEITNRLLSIQHILTFCGVGAPEL